MILSTTVKIKVVPKTSGYYKNLGYKFNINDDILVDINHLTKGSHSMLDVSCDYCQALYKTKYSQYLKGKDKLVKKDACFKCRHIKMTECINIEIYGIENPLTPYSKICSECKLERNISEYHKNRNKYTSKCKVCVSKHTKEYRELNRDILIEKSKSYNKKNEKKVKEYNKSYAQENKVILNEKRKQKQIERYDTDTLYRLKINVRNQINRAFKNNTKHRKSTEILGCSIEEFKVYIENQFVDNMSWDNYGEWHLDHIKPISWAQTYDEILEFNNYLNFKPMWAIDNIKKGNRFAG